MNLNRWQLNLAGLLNFWYYDEEQFEFSNGKLLLRGTNGSGKSVTMQSLVPILLDGKKSPDRLDPFGSRARKIEDYLLGEKDVVDREERTGYLYLEYKREHTEQYLTTGIGLRAKRQGQLEFWGFVIHDNRRIGKDFLLYKTELHPDTGAQQKIPYTRKELEHRLEQGGIVVQSQKEYMEQVNKYVFGFETIEAYDDLIKLLIQLRSPKLSKDFRPTVIYEILNAALPALSDDELRPLSDTIEHMDQIKQQLDQFIRDQAALAKLCKQYDSYNRYVLVDKAMGLLRNFQRQDDHLNKLRQWEHKLDCFKQEKDHYTDELAALRREQNVLIAEEEQLKKHDVFAMEKEKQQFELQLGELQSKQRRDQDQLENKQTNERQLQAQIKNLEQDHRHTEIEIGDLLDELSTLAEEAQFERHELALEEFEGKLKGDFYFDLWKKDLRDYIQQLESVLYKLREQTQAKERHTELDHELGEARRTFELAQIEQQRWQQLFDDERSHFVEQVHHWRQHNEQLIIADEQMTIISAKAQTICELARIDQVKAPIVEVYEQHLTRLLQESASVQSDTKLLDDLLKVKTRELLEWRAKKDPEPSRHEETSYAREQLAEAGIPFLPLYAAVEFMDHISEQHRERLEAAIAQSGMLDALIVSSGSKIKIQSDRVLQPNPQLFKHTLADYMIPTPHANVNVSSEDIMAILQSIVLGDWEHGVVSIAEDGMYRIGLIQGHAPTTSEAQYIGKEARRCLRLREIERLEHEQAELLEQKKLLGHRLELLKNDQQLLKKELETFPSHQNSQDAYDELRAKRDQVQSSLKEVELRNGYVREAAYKLQQIRSELQTMTLQLNLEPNEATYMKAKELLMNYSDQLTTLELKYKDLSTNAEQIRQSAARLLEDQETVDWLKGEIASLRSNIEQLSQKIERMSDLLTEHGADEIRARIRIVVSRLQELPTMIEETSNNRVRKEEEMKSAGDQIESLSGQKQDVRRLTELWSEIFLTELKLQFVKKIDELEHSLDEPLSLIQIAEHIQREHGSLLSKDQDRDKLTTRLTQTFYESQAVLIEYRLVQDYGTEVNWRDEFSQAQEYRLLADELHQKARRTSISLEYEGKRVTPYYVLEQLNRKIELQQTVLDAKDQELFEEIIMNNVGRMIRYRIQRAEQWVDKINRLMDERDTSSGLKFSIRWKPKTAEIEAEMDTKELVELLRTDAKLLSERDFEKVTHHFRSKIARAKEFVEGKAYGEALHDVIKDLLDYRQWFTFILFYERAGENGKRELTNTVFDKFSGGEKAMAMYIPLFSAVYSRYSEARKDAPYLISLDEAFAGVDENNIRDMFDLLEKLGFNYIMNSQALWGDYDTVHSLSICELVRPKNAPFVTVVRYRWDGRVKFLMHQFEAAASLAERQEEIEDWEDE